MCAEAKRVRAGGGAPASRVGGRTDAGWRLADLLRWMAAQDFRTITEGEPSLLRQVERIIVAAHRSVHEVKGRSWSEPVAYRWLRYEDPNPVRRLSEGLEKLRRRGAQVDDNAVDKAC